MMSAHCTPSVSAEAPCVTECCRSVNGHEKRCCRAAAAVHCVMHGRRPARLRCYASDERAAVQQNVCRRARVLERAAQGLAAWSASALTCVEPARAAVHTEPANALSLPTWAIHVSSTVEWAVAMYLVWRYAEVTGNERWKGLTWGMMPLFGGALAACTYHFFYNSPSLNALVALQAGLTFLGNTTCAVAAYRIYQGSRASSGSQ